MIPLTGVPGTGKFIELNVKLKLLRWRERKRGSYYSMGIVFVWGDDKVLEMGCTLKKSYPFMLKKKKSKDVKSTKGRFVEGQVNQFGFRRRFLKGWMPTLV